MQTGPHAIVVTQPGGAGSRLAAELQACGRVVQWLPAFEFGPAPEPQRVLATLQRAGEYDLVIFVSPQAVRAAFAALAADDAAWEAVQRFAVVGSSTAAEFKRALGGRLQQLIAPAKPAAGDGDATSAAGSEALWEVLRDVEPPARNVLLLRAQQGREWLTESLQARGARVTALAVYARMPLMIEAGQRSALAGLASHPLASIFTSSEAVEVIASQLVGSPVLDALKIGPALASHPRIRSTLEAAGFACVRQAPARADAVDGMLREIERIESPRGV